MLYSISMSDTDKKILDTLTSLTKQVDQLSASQKEIRATQQEQGKKLDTLTEKVDHLSDGQGQIRTTLKSLEGMLKETKEEVDEIKRRQYPRKVD
jgi:chromosome segregation ATPase